MNKSSFLTIPLALLPLVSIASTHQFELTAADTRFNWEEYAQGKERVINNEDGSLSTTSLGYSFIQDDYQIGIKILTSRGSIDYLGERKGSIDHKKYSTTSDYSLTEYEVFYGKYIYTDYIKPFAYINGGYQDRERIINPFPQLPNRNAEQYNFYFWGVGLDSELLNWNNVSINGGLYFKNYVMGKVESIDYGFTKPLEQLKITGYKLGVSYSFFERYNASVTYLSESGSIARSNDYTYTEMINGVEATKTSTQPESEQKVKQIRLSVSFGF